MPAGNEFRHQCYTSDPPTAAYRLVSAPPPDKEGSAERRTMQRFGERLRERKVTAIYLVHGTFTGTDALGLIRELERLIPSAGETLRAKQKDVIDAFVGDSGNYSAEYAARLAELINQGQNSHLPVQVFHWTSENLHLARANAAVRLLDELLQQAQRGPIRCLLWGHSHAGNVFALLTNLIGGTRRSRRQFFVAGRSIFRWSVLGSLDQSVWRRVRRQVLGHPEILQRIQVDLVTFGTPIRYGWETRGYASLLHFIHHRPAQNTPEYLVPFPSLRELKEARYGDYVQQLGLAGTNLTPYVFAFRSWIAERRFRLLLQRGIRRRDTLERLRLGQRVPAEGATRLVDYPNWGPHHAGTALGHAVYTWTEWLGFHADQLMESWSLERRL